MDCTLPIIHHTFGKQAKDLFGNSTGTGTVMDIRLDTGTVHGYPDTGYG